MSDGKAKLIHTQEMPVWRRVNRATHEARLIADRHYNRQKVGSPQFVPPGRCAVFLVPSALWVTSWPYAQYTKHAWAGAWVNSCFRKEVEDGDASAYIRSAVAATRTIWEPPELGMITFVDPQHVKPTRRRGRDIYGYAYLKAGFNHVGFTKGGLWAWQLLPADMPEPGCLVPYE